MPNASLILLLLLCCAGEAIASEDQNDDCQQRAAAIKAAMTRGDVEKFMQHDGGLAGVYKGERLFLREPGTEIGTDWKRQYCMLVIDFQPYGVPDEIYRDSNRFARWMETTGDHRDARDAVVRLSAPFLAHLSAD